MVKDETKAGAAPIRVDGHRWMMQLHIAPYHIATLRNMHLNDIFWVGTFQCPSGIKNHTGSCKAYITRERGKFRFDALSLFSFGNRQHTHIWTFGRFKLLKASQIEFAEDTDQETLRAFKLVCRYIAFIDRNSQRYGFENFTQRPMHRGGTIGISTLWWETISYPNGYTRYGVVGPKEDFELQPKGRNYTHTQEPSTTG